MQYCPICGFADLGYRPFDTYGFPDEEVCPCCNVCPCCAYDFVQGENPGAHRAGWIAGGMLWRDRYWKQIEGYDPVAQTAARDGGAADDKRSFGAILCDVGPACP